MGETKQILYDIEFRELPTHMGADINYIRQVYGAKLINQNPRHCTIQNIPKERLQGILEDKNMTGYKLFPYISYPPEMSFRKSSSYREKYIRKHPPFYKGGYRCTYCGCFVSKEEMQVDHIISVAQGKMSKSTQDKIFKKGWKGINDERNLTCSCAGCNDYKSDKGGIWILRGMVRKNKWYWPVRRVVETLALAAVLFLFREQIIECGALVFNDYLNYLPK